MELASQHGKHRAIRLFLDNIANRRMHPQCPREHSIIIDTCGNSQTLARRPNSRSGPSSIGQRVVDIRPMPRFPSMWNEESSVSSISTPWDSFYANEPRLLAGALGKPGFRVGNVAQYDRDCDAASLEHLGRRNAAKPGTARVFTLRARTGTTTRNCKPAGVQSRRPSQESTSACRYRHASIRPATARTPRT